MATAGVAFVLAGLAAAAGAGFLDGPGLALGVADGLAADVRAVAALAGLAGLAAPTFFAAVAGLALGAGLAADFAGALRAGAAVVFPPGFFAAGAAALARFAVVFVTAISLQRLRHAPL